MLLLAFILAAPNNRDLLLGHSANRVIVVTPRCQSERKTFPKRERFTLNKADDDARAR